MAALGLAFALANYGVLATASAHTHEAIGFHQVHVAVDDHNDDHHHDDAGDVDGDENAPGSEHHESGYHSHSSPQFGPADAQTALALLVIEGRAVWPDPADARSPSRDGRPFKPPRTHL